MFIQEALTKVGLPDQDAADVAALMAEADLQGSDGHGVTRLPQYIRRIKAGGFNVRPNIQIMHDHISTAVLNGDNGMGHLAMKRAAEIAIEKARVSGIAWVNSQFSNHAGPASLYATMPLAHDMIGLYFAVGNANHLPPGAVSTCCCRPIRSRQQFPPETKSLLYSIWQRRWPPMER